MSSPFLTRSPTNVNVLMSQLNTFDGLLKKHNVCSSMVKTTFLKSLPGATPFCRDPS